MPLRVSGTAKFEHVESGNILNIQSEALSWEESGDERSMGPEIEHSAEVDMGDGLNFSWSIWEYPEGIENYRETKAPEGFELLHDFDLEIYSS